MAVLVRHRMVGWSTEESGRLVYSVQHDNILAIMRYPHFISSVRSSHGELAAVILEQVIKSGTESLTGVLTAIGRKLITSEATTKDNLGKSLADIQKIFLNLLEQKYFLSTGDKQECDIGAICEAIMNQSSTLPQDKTYYHLNVNKFTQITRNKMLVDAAKR